MPLKRKPAPKLFGLGFLFLILFASSQNARAFQDSTRFKKDTLPFPIHDTRGDFLSNDKRTFDLNQPSNIKDSVEYDPVTKRYYVYERVGTKFYRTPTWYTA